MKNSVVRKVRTDFHPRNYVLVIPTVQIVPIMYLWESPDTSQSKIWAYVYAPQQGALCKIM